jgi:hypothetical protein
MNRRLIALTLAATAMFGLTACSGGGSEKPAAEASASESMSASAAPESQSVEDACAAVNATIQGVSEDFANVSAEDPASAAAAFKAAADALGQAGDQVGNAEVAAVLPDLKTAFETTGAAFDALAQGDTSKITEIQALSTDLQASITSFQELCLP